MEQLTEKIIGITREAGAAIMGYYRSAFDVTEKAPDNPVTDADLAADRLLRQRLMALLPEAGWLSEETADSPERLTKERVWVVDPLDGTKEFVLGLPEFSLSVALVERGQPLVGVVFNPATAELFAAVRGRGLTLNGQPAAVSQRATFEGSLVEASRSERKRGEFAPFEDVVKLETVGSIAYKLARTAAGMADATWSRGPKHEWDICAGVLLVQAAGGTCVDLDGNAFVFNQPWPKVKGIIANNGVLHAAVMAALAPHRASARTD